MKQANLHLKKSTILVLSQNESMYSSSKSLYKADETGKNKIAINDITITFVSRTFPRKLAKHLKQIHNYDIQYIENGIYYIKGDFFPIQFIVTKDLTNEQNLWLHNLTNDIHNSDVVDTLISEYDKHKKDNHYRSVMDILVHANKEAFKGGAIMCKALEDLYWEVHGERIQREQQKALNEAVNEAVAKKEAIIASQDAIITSQDAYIKQLETQLGIAHT